MLEGVTNNITVNKQNPYWNIGTTANNPAQTTTGKLERQPMTDNVELKKKPMSKQTKTLLTLGGIATAVIGTVLAVKGYRSHQITKGLEQIEHKFLKLQENIPEVQKTFKDVFLREDITEKEALEILNRYKEVEKISVTGTKQEYIQAVFEEAKRNFGFKDSKFKLILEKGKVSKNGKTEGGAAQLCTRVEVDPNSKIEQIQGIIHHEMRHMKQNYYAVNYDPQAYKYALRNDCEAKLSKEALEEVLDDCLLDIQRMFNLKTFSRDNIPTGHMEYAKQCLEGCKTYIDGHSNFNAYYMNFKEVDARHAGGLIDKLFNGAVLGGNK